MAPTAPSQVPAPHDCPRSSRPSRCLVSFRGSTRHVCRWARYAQAVRGARVRWLPRASDMASDGAPTGSAAEVSVPHLQFTPDSNTGGVKRQRPNDEGRSSTPHGSAGGSPRPAKAARTAAATGDAADADTGAGSTDGTQTAPGAGSDARTAGACASSVAHGAGCGGGEASGSHGTLVSARAGSPTAQLEPPAQQQGGQHQVRFRARCCLPPEHRCVRVRGFR